MNLSSSEMKRLQGLFPNGEYEDMWNKLFLMYDYFNEMEIEVSTYFNFVCDKVETKRVKEFLIKRRDEIQ